MLRLYDYAPSGNCYKVRLLLSHLGQEYERVPVDIFAGETMTAEYGKKNPGLTTPVLEIEEGVYLPESGAILLHLAEGSEYLPGDPLERAQVHRWLFYEQSRVVPFVAGLGFRIQTRRLEPGSRAAQSQAKIANAIVATVDAHLSGREYVATDRYTVADVALYGYLHKADEGGLSMEPFANLAAWLDRVREQPGYMNDLVPYPENTYPGVSRSIYDAFDV